MASDFAFRPGTNDEAMFWHLVHHNEYRLPEQFDPEDLILDIGVHIGGFSYSAANRGARRVVGYEAEAGNYACAVKNLASFADRVRLVNRAVWRSDRPAVRLSYTYSEDPMNTGGGSVVWEADGPVCDTVAFDEVLTEVTESGRRRVTLVKIDCEGSEFPILLTSRRLDLIERIAGEFHEYGCDNNPQRIPEQAQVAGIPEFTIEALRACLERAGFQVQWERHGQSSLGLFFAERPMSPSRPSGRLRALWRNLTSRKPHDMQDAGATTQRTRR